MRISVFAALGVALFCFACSATPETQPTEAAEQRSELVISNYTAWNTVTSGLPASSTHFCHLTMVSGASAHSQSLMMTLFKIPYCGGMATVTQGLSSGFLSATPNGCEPGTKQGDFVAWAQCDGWGNFGGGGGLSSTFTHNFGAPANATPVSAATLLWDTNSACAITELGSLSFGSEKVWLDIPNGWNWRLNSSGYRALSGEARCAWLGHAPTYSWLEATPGNPQSSGMATSAGICLLYHVEGSLDDGWAALTTSGGVWGLDVGGTVVRAKAYCLPY